MATKLTVTQQRILNAVIARGGEVNGYAGQSGLNVLSLDSLVRRGILERVPPCDACSYENRDQGQPCRRPLLDQPGGTSCYNRMRVTR